MKKIGKKKRQGKTVMTKRQRNHWRELWQRRRRLRQPRSEHRRRKGASTKMTVAPQCSDVPTFQLFREQEKENGNVMSVEKEVSKVNRYCKWWVFRMVKWPTEEMLEFSEETDEMTLEEKSQERGLICRQVIKKFGSCLDDKEGWWRMVNGKILLTMGKRRAHMAEVIKKTCQGEFDMAWRVAQLESE